jgi:putative ABC transport system permease protein
MFARLVARGLWQRKSRALIALAALTISATLTAALFNLHFDAQRKIRSEFSRYGPNVMMTPRATSPELLPAALARELRGELAPQADSAPAGSLVGVAPYLYAIVEANKESVVLAGTWLDQFARLGGYQLEAGEALAASSESGNQLWAGTVAARRLNLKLGDSVTLRYAGRERVFHLAGILSTGAAEDAQFLAELSAVEALTASPGVLNAVLARVAGDAPAVERKVAEWATRFPAAAVNPLRQVTQAEFRVVEQIRWAMAGITLIVLLITSLCVLATMTAQAFERRQTVGTLKALGATEARLAALFLGEAVAMALVAAGAGFVGGAVLARWLGATLFAASVTLSWSALPLVLLVTLAVALAGAYFPLRLVRQTQPAVILRGE